MKLPILYSQTSKSQTQTWQIIVSGNSYFTKEGIKDGTISESKPTICFGKNVGKKNETSATDQATKEAKAKWQKKLDKGYWENIADIDKAKFIEPMLAKNYEDFKDKLEFPIYSQPKLDGIRCIATKNGLFSRYGKKIISCPHLEEGLKVFFKKYPDAVLDGEFYNHDLKEDFDKIVSLVRKTKPTKEDLEESAKIIQYHIYDYISEGTFSRRRSSLIMNLKNCYINDDIFIIVETELIHKILLDFKYEYYLSQGYEGQMLRLDKEYENKRTKSLLKRKSWQTEEFKILNIVEGQGNKTGMAGFVICEKKNKTQFKSNIKGTHEYLKELLENKQKYIGEMGTIKYQNLTPDGIPRFGYLIAFRNYE